jgi:hypothetical protein
MLGPATSCTRVYCCGCCLPIFGLAVHAVVQALVCGAILWINSSRGSCPEGLLQVLLLIRSAFVWHCVMPCHDVHDGRAVCKALCTEGVVSWNHRTHTGTTS